MMGEIFSQASEMRAFITDVDENKFKALRSAASRAQACGNWAAQNWWLQARQAAEEEYAMDHAEPSRIPGYQGLKALLGSRYWTRTWILQEFVLPYRVALQCGNTIWGAHMLVEWLENPDNQIRQKLAVHSVQSQRSEFAKTTIAILCRNRLRKKRDRKVNEVARKIHKLGDLLVECQGHDCSERKDKVYALLGLCHPAYQRELVVDYDLSLLETFHEVLQCISKLETKSSTNMRNAAVLYKELLAYICAYSLKLQLDACTTLKGDFVAEAYFRGEVVDQRILLPAEEIYLDRRWDMAINAPMLLHRLLVANGYGWLLPQKSSILPERRRILCDCEMLKVFGQVNIIPGDQIWQFLNTEKGLVVRRIARNYLILGGALFQKRKYSSFSEMESRLCESRVIRDVERRSIRMNTQKLLEYSSWLQTPSYDEEQSEDDQPEDLRPEGNSARHADSLSFLWNNTSNNTDADLRDDDFLDSSDDDLENLPNG